MKEICVEVKILPKPEILDVQGRAVVQTLKQNGKPIQDCRYGKCIHLQLKAEDERSAMDQAQKIAELVLYNPLTETYEMKVIS